MAIEKSAMDIPDSDEPPKEADYVLRLAQQLYHLRLKNDEKCAVSSVGDGGVNGECEMDINDVQAELLKRGMVKKYESVCDEFDLMVDAEQLDGAVAKNIEKEKELEEKIKDAEENLGEVEVRDALLAKACFYRSIGDDEKAKPAFKLTEDKTAGVGQKMDIIFMQLRTCMAEGNWAGVKKLLQKAKQLFELGGDWERKNRLKVYEGIHALATRQFKPAAELFLDSVTTFTCSELFDYTTLVFYTVITSVVSLDRVTLKKKVIDSPEVRSVIGKVPHLEDLIHSLYECKYSGYLKAMLGLSPVIYKNMYLNAHFRYTIRELRVVGYYQFLESYRSITMSSMANSFGLSVDFLDKYVYCGQDLILSRSRLGPSLYL